MGNPNFQGMGTWWESAYDDHVGPNPEEVAENYRQAEERGNQERIAHTYHLKCGDVSFECYLPYSSPKDGKMWVKMEASQLPEEMLTDVSVETLQRALKSSHGYIEGNFLQEEDGVFVASDVWMNRFEYACEKVRKSHKIIIEGEEYHFPVFDLNIREKGSTAKANVHGQVFPLVRGKECWVLDV